MNEENRVDTNVVETDNKETNITDTSNNRKKKNSKKTVKMIIVIVIILVLLLVLGIGALVFASKKAMDKANSAMESEALYEVVKEDVEQEIETTGTVVGTDEYAYASPVSAQVQDVKVEVGQIVHKGDVLLTYDASLLGDNLEKVKIQANSQKAAGSESYEAANKAASKAEEAKARIQELDGEIASIQGRVAELQVIVNTYEAEHKATKSSKEDEEEDLDSLVEKTSDDKNSEENKKKEKTTEKTTEAPVYTVDTETYAKAAAELEQLAASLTEKQTERESKKALVESAADATVSGSAAAQISANNQLADISVNEAQSSLDKAEAGIVADRTGIIQSVNAVPGAFAQEGEVVVTIIDSKKIGVEFSFARDDLEYVKIGQKARMTIAGYDYTGKVDFVSKIAVAAQSLGEGTSSNSSIRGRIIIDNPDENIFIGVPAKTFVFVGKAEDALTVPYSAINTDVDGDFVYIVNDENLIERKDIKIGIHSDEKYEITEGLKAGDKVINDVTDTMKPGDPYVPATAGMVSK